MADNTTLNAGTGGDTIASDDIAGIKHQRVKLSVGADGAATDAVPVSNGMDVTGAAVQAVGVVAQVDDSATSTVTEDQFGPVRMSTRRALLVEGVASGTAMAVSLASVPSHAVTNAGTFAVQESGSALTALQLIDNLVLAEDAAHVSGDVGVQALSVRTDTAAARAGTDGDYQPLITDASGRLHVNGSGVTQPVSGTVTANLAAGTNNIGDVDVLTLPALPAGTNNIGDVDVLTVPTDPFGANADAASATGSISAKLRFIASTGIPVTGTVTVGSHAVTNAGTFAVQADSVVPGTGATNLGKAEDAAHTTGDVGVMALAVRSAAPSDRSAGPTDGDYEPLAVNEVGAAWVTHTHSANGGASTMNASSSDGGTALTSTAQVIKASAGTLVGYYIYNPNSSAQFVQFYNTAAASVTVGTTNPLFMITIPATSGANLWMPGGVAFGTAMSWAATSTAGGSGAPTTALDAVCWYK